LFGYSVRILAVLCPAAVAVTSAQCRFPTQGAGRLLAYTFNASVTPARTVLHITLGFKGGSKGTEEIEVPTEWAGKKLHGIINLRALSKVTVIAGSTVHYPRNHPVVLTYDMVKDWTGPFNHPMQFHGVVLPEYIEINGDNALIHPKAEDAAPVTVNFDWREIPENWVRATSFGTSSCQTYTGRWMDVEQALFTAGQFRMYHFQIGAKPALLAIRGEWTFTDEEVVSAVDKTVGAVRDFWHDDNFPYFLITLKQFDHERRSGDGSQFTNAFWLYMSRLDPLSAYLPMLAHEAFHAWTPGRMGAMPDNERERIGWFWEGFTRYYGNLLVYRAGLMPLSEYLDGINFNLRKLPGSDDPNDRGRLIALWLDGRIRKDSNNQSSLDNVMFDMVHEADKPLTEAGILETAGRYLAPDSRVQLDQIVGSGAKIADLDDALGSCAHVSLEELPTFDLGLDLAASMEAHKVTGVRPDSPAFKAGLRNDQKLLEWSVYNDQPDKAAKFTIATDDGGKTKIEYYPKGKIITVPQYHLDPGACRTP
jgi:predicted metalloprotease with PDZ domain